MAVVDKTRASRLGRYQVLLEQEQRDRLAKLAEVQGKSVSGLLREMVASYLAEQETADEHERFRQLLEDMRRFREENRRLYGDYPGDPMAEARAALEVDTEWLVDAPKQ